MVETCHTDLRLHLVCHWVRISCLCILNAPFMLCRAAYTVENINYDSQGQKGHFLQLLFICLIKRLKTVYLFTEIQHINWLSLESKGIVVFCVFGIISVLKEHQLGHDAGGIANSSITPASVIAWHQYNGTRWRLKWITPPIEGNSIMGQW